MAQRLTIRGSDPGWGEGFFSSRERPDWIWAYPTPLFNGYLGLFSQSEKVFTDRLVVKLGIGGAILQIPLYAFVMWTDKFIFLNNKMPPRICVETREPVYHLTFSLIVDGFA